MANTVPSEAAELLHQWMLDKTCDRDLEQRMMDATTDWIGRHVEHALPDESYRPPIWQYHAEVQVWTSSPVAWECTLIQWAANIRFARMMTNTAHFPCHIKAQEPTKSTGRTPVDIIVSISFVAFELAATC
jgi:hypothetical protein